MGALNMNDDLIEDLEYKRYLSNNLLIAVCEKLHICSREYFILKYNLSLSEIKYIDEVFKFCVVNDIRDFPSFKNEIQKKIPRFTSDNIFELLLEAYEFHQPISRKILDSTQ